MAPHNRAPALQYSKPWGTLCLDVWVFAERGQTRGRETGLSRVFGL